MCKRLRELTRADVDIVISTEEEYDDPAGFFATEDEEADAAEVADIKRRVRMGDPWAWCTVVVTVSWKDQQGRTCLGACSYESEDDFRENSCYFDQMVDDAIQDLNQNVHNTYSNIATLTVEE